MTRWTEALLKYTLRGGSVFYLQHRRLTSAKPHFCVVVNLSPLDDEQLVLVIASSRVADVKRRRNGLPGETIVEIEPAEYSDFTVPSVIDCNDWIPTTQRELLQKLQAGQAVEKMRMPDTLLVKLRAGMLASPLIEDEIKDLLRHRV